VSELFTIDEAAEKKKPKLTHGVDWTFVYFIRTGDFIKIGKSDAWRHRLSHIRTASPYVTAPVLVEVAHPTYEKKLHLKFKSLHHRGEWFKAEPLLLEYIERRKSENGCVMWRTEMGW